MALFTSNYYGNITISDDVIMMATNRVALECYGVVDLVSRRFSDSVLAMFNKSPATKGVKVATVQDKMYIDIYVVLKSGINSDAVVKSLRELVIYRIEYLTGMRVKSVNVNVVGVRL
ncbi:MAG: Asp23/Gls24 family envelope stress response protein [Christensenellaceae bacterium]|jgi:uncharacterized alkaline shock family protein YloU|nr:Asp23/Gls24 family envelope stress response protein [Christensenellaceae bacterium]